MKKPALVIVFLLCTVLSFAQKGSKSVLVTGEAILPGAETTAGSGMTLKVLYGITKSGQLTFTGGFSGYKILNLNREREAKVRLFQFLAGYRQWVHTIYLEPKAGFGEVGGSILLDGGDFAKPSVTALIGGIEAGFFYRRVGIGADFLAFNGVSNKSAGTWYNKHFYYTGINIGYILFKK